MCTAAADEHKMWRKVFVDMDSGTYQILKNIEDRPNHLLVGYRYESDRVVNDSIYQQQFSELVSSSTNLPKDLRNIILGYCFLKE